MVAATGSCTISAVSEPAPTKIASVSGMPAQARARTSPGTITAAVVIAAVMVKKRTSSSSISAANAATRGGARASLHGTDGARVGEMSRDQGDIDLNRS